MPPASPESLLLKGCSTLGIRLNPKQVEQFLSYLELLKHWNRRLNLTSLKDDTSIIERHFLDSLMGTKGFQAEPKQGLLDIGTGAGFPGIPLKILRPGIALSLVEPSQKKSAFLHQACGALNLHGVSILTTRVEDLRKSEGHKGSYDIVTLRAFAKPIQALKTGLPFLAGQGCLLMYLTPSTLTGLEYPEGWDGERTDYVLPFSGAGRSLVAVQRKK